MRKYYNFIFLLSTLLVYAFPYTPFVHKPFLYILLLPLALFFNGLDRQLIQIYKSKINFILFFLIFFGILYEILRIFISFDFLLINNHLKYFAYNLIILFFLLSLVFGVNLKKILNFNSILICNSIILTVILIQIFELNFISYKICNFFDSKLFIGTNYCVSITEGMKGFSLLTTEPSFGAMQLVFFFILNLFFLKNFDLKPYEKKIINFFLLIFSISLLFMNSELGLLFFILIFFSNTYKYLKKIILKIKINLRDYYFIIILVSFILIYVLNIVIDTSFLFITNTKCYNEFYTILPRIFYYFIFIYDPSFSFINHESNSQLIEIVDKIQYFDYCNSLLERSILTMPLKIIPQPIFLKFMYFVNIFVGILFGIFIIKVLFQNFKINILKILILVYILICIFLQGSFLMIYSTLLLQIYLNDRN